MAEAANCLAGNRNRTTGGSGKVQTIDAATFHRKLEARKIFQHRQLLESAIEKASQQLEKVTQISSSSYSSLSDDR